jgi:methanogenic corrinoid protein MtbC1
MGTPVTRVLSPRQLALAIGVSESSLKRWADQGLIHVSRTAGGHRRIPIAEAIRFVRDSEATLVRPEILGLPDVEAVSGDLPARNDEIDRLFTYLRDGRAREARGLVMSIYLGGRTVAEICDGPIRHAMHRLGELWQHDAEGIFVEHRATDICIQAVNQLRLVFENPPDAPSAVGCAPAGDRYILPSLVTATVLKAEGFRAVNLGADTPTRSLLQAATEHAARLVWISTSVADANPKLPDEVAELADELAQRRGSLIIGGQARDAVAWPKRTNIHVGSSMGELLAFARGMRLAGGAAT